MEPKANKRSAELQRLLKALDFQPEDLIKAAAEQPGLFRDMAEVRMLAFRQRAKAEAEYEVEKANISMVIRSDARGSGERITEAAITEKLLLSKRIQSLAEILSRAEEEEEFTKLVLEAFRMRRDCLKIVEDFMGAELAWQKALQAGSNKMATIRGRLQQKWPRAKE